MRFLLACTLVVSLGLGCSSGGAQSTAAPDSPPAQPASQPASQPAAQAPKAFDAPPAVGTAATCAVSGHAFEVEDDSPSSEYGGKTYVFCCPDCKPAFDKDPAKYAVGG